MMARLYYLGLGIDAILLALACGNAFVMCSMPDVMNEGLTGVGQLALWAIPLVLLGLMGAARTLRARGALGAATALVWLPALPFGLALVFWVGLAVVFVVFGR